MYPKKILISFMVLLIIILGYGLIREPAEPTEKQAMEAIRHETNGIEDLNIHQIQRFRKQWLILYSYDLGDSHYIACRFLDARGRLSGGSGPSWVDQRQVISMTSFGEQPNDYLIIYGEIHNPGIKSVEVFFHDGWKMEVKQKEGTYLIITDKSIKEVFTLKAYNRQGGIVYHLP